HCEQDCPRLADGKSTSLYAALRYPTARCPDYWTCCHITNGHPWEILRIITPIAVVIHRRGPASGEACNPLQSGEPRRTHSVTSRRRPWISASRALISASISARGLGGTCL